MRHRALVLDRLLADVRILIVEDDPDSREMLAVVLEQSGASVTTAASVLEAFVAFIAVKPDIVVSDIDMPGLSGEILVHQIRALTPETGSGTPVIAVTGGGLSREAALAHGFDAYVPKPIGLPSLFSAVLRHCRRSPGAA